MSSKSQRVEVASEGRRGPSLQRVEGARLERVEGARRSAAKLRGKQAAAVRQAEQLFAEGIFSQAELDCELALISGVAQGRAVGIWAVMPTRHDTTHATTGSQAPRTVLGSGPANPTRRPVRDSAVGTTQPSRPPVSEPARRRRAVDTAQSRTPVQLSAVRNSAAPTRRPVRDSGRNSASGPGDATPAAGSIRRTLEVRALPLRCRE